MKQPFIKRTLRGLPRRVVYSLFLFLSACEDPNIALQYEVGEQKKTCDELRDTLKEQKIQRDIFVRNAERKLQSILASNELLISEVRILQEQKAALHEEREELQQNKQAAKNIDLLDRVVFLSGKEFNGRVTELSGNEVALQNAAGRSMRGALKKISSIEFRVPNLTPTEGKKKEIKTRKTSNLRAKAPSDISLKISPYLIDMQTVRQGGMGKRNNYTSGNMIYITNKKQNAGVKTIIKNKHLKNEMRDYKLEQYVLARGITNKKNYKLIIKEIHDVNIGPGMVVDFLSDALELEFSDGGLMGKHGFEYYGYLTILTNPTGEVVHTKHIPKRLKDAIEKIKNTPKNQIIKL